VNKKEEKANKEKKPKFPLQRRAKREREKKKRENWGTTGYSSMRITSPLIK
jgi:hypothetical protein